MDKNSCSFYFVCLHNASLLRILLIENNYIFGHNKLCLFFCFCFILDWNKRIEYKPGSGSIPLFPSIRLETCDGPVSSIQTTIELQTNYIGKGCDRETYSEKSLQKLCGMHSFIHSFRMFLFISLEMLNFQ